MGDLRSLIEKQELYIGQLEKETKFCREQLAKVLAQVQVGCNADKSFVRESNATSKGLLAKKHKSQHWLQSHKYKRMS